MENVSINKDILVIGGELTGAGTAEKIAAAGYKVILVTPNSREEQAVEALYGVEPAAVKSWQKISGQAGKNKRVETLADTRVLKSAGVAGDFTVRLSTGGGIPFEKKVGAIVVATDLERRNLAEDYGVELSDKILTISQAEARAAAGDMKRAEVGLLAGFAAPGSPLAMRRVFKLVNKIMDEGGDASVYVNDIKLANDDLDRLYKEGRDKGAVYFKMQKAPAINGTSLIFNDPVLNQPVEVTHDLLIIDEALGTDSENLRLAEALGLHMTASGFLQKDNVHRFPVQSNRRGMFVTGSARDIKNLTECVTDIDNVVMELGGLFAELPVPPEVVAMVNREKCVTCLTCFRCCPHGAIYWDDKAVISEVACQGCGICASECPNDAIQVETYSDDGIIGLIQAGLQQTPNAIVAFCCENSATEAAGSARRFGLELPDNLMLIPVPCAGKVDLSYILNAFAEGAGGVMVIACHNGNCKSEYGSQYARWRVNEAFRMLEETGIEKNRLAFVTLAANMASDFARAARSMAAQMVSA
ncbi:MAG: hydrogenase iron-sulfur subunit [Desulfosudaceae bacterium]